MCTSARYCDQYMQSIIKLLISVYKFIYITNLSMYIMYLKTQYFTRNKSEIDII